MRPSISRQAVDAALNEYRPGTVSFTTVVLAQATLLSNEQTALAIRRNPLLRQRQSHQALGGGWDTRDLPGFEELRRSCVDVRGAIRGPVSPELPA